ncbi:bifunctional metallophosphatase/5'-nucleotidase [Corynebacterium afermentans]|uniref:bifunctional metallophosphatase/5'-nucleotidase n=1 Tax=Corynebacterium afermentans TaxID=38286 RepID=UPI0025733611|nr:bifunctional UDP-sugar hydrolase/5'-nucleotidase [Corynebacterium afermentans]MCG7292691.1 bifunctional metallophosphatase/5'-nucleotidase [Corynebacterium afermentans]
MFDFRRAGALIAATTTTAVVLTAAPFVAAAEADQVTINVANITDFHGRLEYNERNKEMGAANVAGIMNYIRSKNPNTIVTNSGDNQGGSAFISAISDDKYTMDFVNAIGTDGTAVGNHEFDKGYQDLIERIIPGTNDKQIGANIFKEDGTREVKPYIIVERDGVKIALVGTTSNLTVAKSNPENVKGLDIRDSALQVNEEAKKIKDNGEADVVIALIHDPAKEASEKLDKDYVDFVFGGDSHIQDMNVDADVPYFQSYEYGKIVTDLTFTFDKETKDIVSHSAEQYDITDLEKLGITPDEEVEALVAEAKAEADKLGEKVVAEVGATFKRGSNPGDKPGTNRGTESTANNMIAESALIALEKFLGEDIDLGVMNAGGVRDDLVKGEVSYKEAFSVQPFSNSIDVASLTGAAIKEALENQWQTPEAAEKSGRPRLDMGLSDNVSYTYNPDAPRGEKITSISIDGKPMEMDKKYRVAASSFLFDGGDNFIAPDNVTERNTVGYNDLQAFVDYLESGAAKIRTGQKDVGVVLPEGGLKAGQKNTIELTSLSYSSEGEPMAKTASVKLGEATAEAEVDNEVTDADKGFGEQGRAKVELEIPAEAAGEQTLEITTDKGTKVSLPVTVAQADKPAEDDGKDKPAKENGSSDAPIGVILGVIAAVLVLVLPLALAFPIDSVLGPIALLNNNK